MQWLWGVFSKVEELWNALSGLRRLDVPMLFAGDFNLLLASSEERGGLFHEDADVLKSREFVDMGFSGPKFTWKSSYRRKFQH